MSEKVKIVCSGCRGLGISVRDKFHEDIPEDVGVICSGCYGSGYKDAEIFEGRIVLSSIKKVAFTIASLDHKDCVTYGEFLKGKIPSLS